MSDQIYKAVIRVPTPEQYAFLEIHHEGTMEALHEAYTAATAMFKHGEGLQDVLFDQFIQNQISGLPNKLEDYNKMSLEQQRYVQINKRAIKRINYKINKEEN